MARREVDAVEVEDAAMAQQAAHVGVDDAPVLVEPWFDIADVHRRARPGGICVSFVRLRTHLLHHDEAVLVIVAALRHVGGLELVPCVESKRCERLRVNRQLRPPAPAAPGLRGAEEQELKLSQDFIFQVC